MESLEMKSGRMDLMFGFLHSTTFLLDFDALFELEEPVSRSFAALKTGLNALRREV